MAWVIPQTLEVRKRDLMKKGLRPFPSLIIAEKLPFMREKKRPDEEGIATRSPSP